MNFKRHKKRLRNEIPDTLWEHRIHDQRQPQLYVYDDYRPRRYVHSRLDQLWGRADARDHRGN